MFAGFLFSKKAGGRGDDTRIFYRQHPLLRLVLIGQWKINSPGKSGKRFF
jgi:hypothetical protein